MNLGEWSLFGIEMPTMLRMGLQGSYILRSNVSGLMFGDQFNNNGIISNSSNDPSHSAPKVPIDPEEFLNDPLIKQALEVFKGRMLKVESST